MSFGLGEKGSTSLGYFVLQSVPSFADLFNSESSVHVLCIEIREEKRREEDTKTVVRDRLSNVGRKEGGVDEYRITVNSTSYKTFAELNKGLEGRVVLLVVGNKAVESILELLDGFHG